MSFAVIATPPTIEGVAVPDLEVCLRFEAGKGWYPVIRNRDTGREYGRGNHLHNLLAAARLAAESLEAAR